MTITKDKLIKELMDTPHSGDTPIFVFDPHTHDIRNIELEIDECQSDRIDLNMKLMNTSKYEYTTEEMEDSISFLDTIMGEEDYIHVEDVMIFMVNRIKNLEAELETLE